MCLDQNSFWMIKKLRQTPNNKIIQTIKCRSYVIIYEKSFVD